MSGTRVWAATFETYEYANEWDWRNGENRIDKVHVVWRMYVSRVSGHVSDVESVCFASPEDGEVTWRFVGPDTPNLCQDCASGLED